MYPPKYNITRSSGMKNAILLWPIMMITMYYLIIHLDIFFVSLVKGKQLYFSCTIQVA